MFALSPCERAEFVREPEQTLQIRVRVNKEYPPNNEKSLQQQNQATTTNHNHRTNNLFQQVIFMEKFITKQHRYNR